ncbi:DUF4288 domain-containing protein [Cellvibrio sp. PSBB023]|uniref:DUF4288 domain-containing protein n=1 Tax=Cellvibrio sp. PSBB023 TaxID=1945512 RepID=UPI00098FB918|nr:DUF4288 domain-containing protein [Cellvibrio sp. PSBB023]AQT61140.1 hypothetical protein B0D95_14320 [Cellvibrio sp. PSBB023]
MWYCAHAIFYYKYANQESFLTHENVYLISAENEDAALLAAEKIAKENEDLNEDGHLYLNDIPAAYVFAGIRKLIEIETNSDTAQGKIISGVEVTYSEMEVDTLEEVVDLADGKFVNILYRE